MSNFQRRNNYKPGTQDDCQTPPYAVTDELASLFRNHCVWECATGNGYLTRALNNQGMDVYSSDVNPQSGNVFDFLYGDVWKYTSVIPVSAIITNPPYSMAIEFMDRCMDIGFPFALLMRAEILFTSGYDKTCKKYGVYPSICIPSSRIDFKMPNMGWEGAGAHFPTAWFVAHAELEPNKVYRWAIQKPKKKDVPELSKDW